MAAPVPHLRASFSPAPAKRHLLGIHPLATATRLPPTPATAFARIASPVGSPRNIHVPAMALMSPQMSHRATMSPTPIRMEPIGTPQMHIKIPTRSPSYSGPLDSSRTTARRSLPGYDVGQPCTLYARARSPLGMGTPTSIVPVTVEVLPQHLLLSTTPTPPYAAVQPQQQPQQHPSPVASSQHAPPPPPPPPTPAAALHQMEPRAAEAPTAPPTPHQQQQPQPQGTAQQLPGGLGEGGGAVMQLLQEAEARLASASEAARRLEAEKRTAEAEADAARHQLQRFADAGREDLRARVAMLEEQLVLARERYRHLDEEKQLVSEEAHRLRQRVQEAAEESRSLHGASQEQQKAEARLTSVLETNRRLEVEKRSAEAEAEAAKLQLQRLADAGREEAKDLRTRVSVLEDQLQLARERYKQLEQDKQLRDEESQRRQLKLQEAEQESRSMQRVYQEQQQADARVSEARLCSALDAARRLEAEKRSAEAEAEAARMQLQRLGDAGREEAKELRTRAAMLDDQLKLAREHYQQLEQEKQLMDEEFHHRQQKFLETEKENRSLQRVIQEQRKVVWDLENQMRQERSLASGCSPGEFLRLVKAFEGENIAVENAQLKKALMNTQCELDAYKQTLAEQEGLMKELHQLRQQLLAPPGRRGD